MSAYLIRLWVDRRNRRPIRLWIPLPVLILILSPLLLFVLAAGVIVLLAKRIPLGVLPAFFDVIWALAGIKINIQNHHTTLRLEIV